MGRAFIGTSGFIYSHWGEGIFYPKDLPQSKWLEYYADQFDSVEINTSFYHLPKRVVFEGWKRRTPTNFVFVPKGSRFITHVKKLQSCQEPIERFFTAASGLGDKLGVVLWQLPPNLKVNSDKLELFCELLNNNKVGKQTRQAFEFRQQSWFVEEVYQILRRHNCAGCIADSNRWPKVEAVTADFVYLRFHGASALYASNYSDRELEAWAKRCRAWQRQGKDVYAYFNNDALGYAVANAKTLKNLLA